jgi:hypothetical protein
MTGTSYERAVRAAESLPCEEQRRCKYGEPGD